MPRSTQISLASHFADFVDEQVRQGNFDSASEVVEAGLKLLEEREAKVTALREALRKGDDSGPGIPFDRHAMLAELKARHGKASD